MQCEYDSLIEYGAWDLVPRPMNCNVTSSKWVYTPRHEATASGDLKIRYKASLVENGFLRIEAVNFYETYAPVVKLTSVRILFSVTAVNDMHLHQMDVKIAFLNGDLDETVYREQPSGYEKLGSEDLVCRLKKAIHGLRQTPRQWHAKIDTFLFDELTSNPNDADEWRYMRTVSGLVLLIALYVDDLLIYCSSMQSMKEVKAALSSSFEMKDLMEAHMILGFEIVRDRARRLLFLTQFAYTKTVLLLFKMDQSKVADTPIECATDLSVCDEPLKNISYRQAIGSLMYLSVGTQPDILHAVSKFANFVEKQCSNHWTAVKRILRYLNGTRSYGITYGISSDVSLGGSSDSDCAGDTSSRKSTSGYKYLLAGGPVSRCSRQQDDVALSGAEGEYVSLCSAPKEGV